MFDDWDDVLFEQNGALGIITLNRPKALNALTHQMCLAIHRQLDAWTHDRSIVAVMIRGEGEKAFCAGGDVVALYESGKAYRDGDRSNTLWREFFRDEYRMNAAIHHFPKPYIAFMDGITMGGGVGVSVHGDFRIVTDRTMLAMPETGIGLMPDVGGGYFLPRLEGELGMYLALKGERIKAADCMHFGIATHCLESHDEHELIDRLSMISGPGEVERVLGGMTVHAGLGEVAPFRDDIDRLFSGNSMQDIMDDLAEEADSWAMQQHRALSKKSPTSLKVTFRQMRQGEKLSFDEEMKTEFRIVNRIIEGHDFYEGVRAILLDKDFEPTWNPDTLKGVSDADVAKHFADLGDLELQFAADYAAD